MITTKKITIGLMELGNITDNPMSWREIITQHLLSYFIIKDSASWIENITKQI